MRTIFSKLLGGFSPALTMAVLVAVIGISGTAWANHGKGNGNGNGNTAAATTTPDTPQVAQTSSFGDNGDWADKSDHHGTSHWKPKHHKKGHGNDNADGADYGVATVNVSRGHDVNGVQNPATAWATYSTALGSPVGDTTGGTFRFTCSTENAPCTVAVAAAVLSGNPGSADFYPRVLIYKQDYVQGGPSVYCEYGDGSVGSLPIAINNQPLSATPTYTPVRIDIGGSADCAGPVTTAHDVSMIVVPAGYYDVHSTFVFAQ